MRTRSSNTARRIRRTIFLPRILTGEVFFCQGYSEPEAGSDLAALSMAAVDDGEDLVCTGSKIWTTHAQEANWMFGLVRTSRGGKKQQGITFVLIDMSSPGIEIRPLVMTSGEEIQNQVFFDEVRVPKSNVIGQIDDGWTVAKYLLEFERGGGASAPALQVMAEEVTAAATSQPGPAGGLLIDDPAFSRKLADARIRTDVLEVLEYRVLSALAGGGHPGSGVLDAQDPHHRTQSNPHRVGHGGRRTARTRLSTPRDTAGRPDRRIRAAARWLRQRPTVAGRRSAALLQRPGRLDLCGQQRDSAQHPGQGSVGALMDFSLSDEQEMLRDGLNKFLATRYGLERSRAAAKTGAGWQPDIWRAFADELGILGAALPEEVGGIGGGPVEVMVIAEALGHALVVEPYVDTAVVAAGLLRRAGGDGAAASWRRIVAGRGDRRPRRRRGAVR